MNANKTKKVKKVNEKTLVVGVDIGKVRNYGYLRCPNGTEIKPFEFLNRRPGFDKLWDRICKTTQVHNLAEVVIGFESTGSYGEPFLHYMMKKGVKIVQVNPMHTKKLKELQGNSPNKTDQKDPKVIADIIELGRALTVVAAEGAAAELRRLTDARERGMKSLTATLNQLQNQVFVLFPEFLDVMKGVNSKTAQYLLEQCTAPQDIVELGLDELTAIMKRISRGQLGKERSKMLYEAAKSTIGIQEGQRSIVFEIKHLLAVIKNSEHYIAELESEMCRYLKEIPYSNSILSIRGIGKVTAAGLIGEAGDFTKFNTIAEIMKFSGLDLFEISSGEKKGNRHISKRGRSLIRKLLFFATINTVRKGGIMHEKYQKYLKRGMPKMKALTAIARKLLRIIFSLVRNHSEYIERCWQLRSIVNYEKIERNLKEAA